GTDGEILERSASARDERREYGAVWSAPLYRTAPIGPAQPPFLNTAVQLRLEDGTPEELIDIVLGIERGLGRDRDREERFGPRKIDLDVLLWGMRVVRTPTIELPHPRLAQRRFALQPVADLLGAMTFPGTHERIWEVLERVRDQAVELVTTDW